MKYFSKVLKILENFKPYTSPKHLIDRAMIAANKIAFTIFLLSVILGLIYRYTEPDIDKNIVYLFRDILLILIYFPYVIALIVMLGSIIQSAFRLIRSGKSFELIKEILKPKRQYSFLQQEQKHDRTNVIHLGKVLSLNELKYYEKVFDKIIKNKETQISDIFGHRAAFFPMLIIVTTLFVTFNIKDSMVRYFSFNEEYQPLDFLVVLIGLLTILVALAALLGKKRNSKYIYWHDLFQQAVVEQQAVAEQKAKDELNNLISTINFQSNKPLPSESTNRISLWRRLVALFAG